MPGRLLRRLFTRSATDFEPGDFVRRYGLWGVGVVESVAEGHAVVAWSKDRRDILPLTALRRTQAGGHSYDRK